MSEDCHDSDSNFQFDYDRSQFSFPVQPDGPWELYQDALCGKPELDFTDTDLKFLKSMRISTES
jgi:hypothetical protein